VFPSDHTMMHDLNIRFLLKIKTDDTLDINYTLSTALFEVVT
jgi:hypothetical protein